MKLQNKKYINIILIVIILILAILFFVKYRDYQKLAQELNLLKSYEFDGMQVTLLGGSNMLEKGNTNSMGYIIRNRSGELIVVDGGRDIDADLVYSYIKKYGNGVVNHWYITHGHTDHVGALNNILQNEKYDIKIENIYYSLLSLEWYEKYDARGYESEKCLIENLNSSKILNKISCTKNQEIQMDNIKCEIIRIANPNITTSDNGNEASMVFKMTAEDVGKSILFLGDAFLKASEELLENPEKLKADAVQMSHHGQNGVTKEVYQTIQPKIALFNAPRWLYDNDNGSGIGSGNWKSLEVRSWLDEMKTLRFAAYECDQTFHFSKSGIYRCIVENT